MSNVLYRITKCRYWDIQLENVGSTRFSFMDPVTVGAASLNLDLNGAIRYCTAYAMEVKDDKYVIVPYNYS